MYYVVVDVSYIVYTCGCEQLLCGSGYYYAPCDRGDESFLQECRLTLASRFVLLIKTGYSIALTFEMTAARYQSLHTRTV